MQRPFSSGSRQTPDPCDLFLEEHSFYRKHVARDSSCLFRVISEQMYDTQMHHQDIRKKCVAYMRKHHTFFGPLVDRDLDGYLDDMARIKTFGGLLELQALGYMFQRNIVLFKPFDLGNFYINRTYHTELFRVFHSPGRHFDSVFTADFITKTAICQSICYELLYTNLFKLPDVSFAVEQMLHPAACEENDYSIDNNENGYCTAVHYADGRSFRLDLPEDTDCILENFKLCHFHYINFPRLSNDLQREIELISKDSDDFANKTVLNKAADALLPDKFTSCVRQLLQEGITPFPYKVAKALDPNMYRNIEFDCWNEARRENKLKNWYNGDSDFKVGAKCHVKLCKSEGDIYTCHIQEIGLDRRFCIVFIEQLGEKRVVPFDSLFPLSLEEFKPWTMPYRLQRHMPKYKSVQFTRHFNCRFKFNGRFSTSSAHEYSGPTSTHLKNELCDFTDGQLTENSSDLKNNNCYYKLKQFTQLENYRTNTIEYCTMPLTVNCDIDSTAIDRENRNYNNSKSMHSSSSVVLKSETVQGALMHEPSQGPTTSAMAIEQNQNYSMMQDISGYTRNVCDDGMLTTNQISYPTINPCSMTRQCYSCDYDNTGNLSQSAAAFIPNVYNGSCCDAGNPLYYYPNTSQFPPACYGPPTNNVYIQPSPNAAIRPTQWDIYTTTSPYYTNTMARPTFCNPSTNNTTASASSGIELLNAGVTECTKSNSVSDMPTDMSIVRYYYKLGLECHNKHLKRSPEAAECDLILTKDNLPKEDKEQHESQPMNQSDINSCNIIDNKNLDSLHMKQQNVVQSNVSNYKLNAQNSYARRFPARYFNNKDRQSYTPQSVQKFK